MDKVDSNLLKRIRNLAASEYRPGGSGVRRTDVEFLQEFTWEDFKQGSEFPPRFIFTVPLSVFGLPDRLYDEYPDTAPEFVGATGTRFYYQFTGKPWVDNSIPADEGWFEVLVESGARTVTVRYSDGSQFETDRRVSIVEFIADMPVTRVEGKVAFYGMVPY